MDYKDYIKQKTFVYHKTLTICIVETLSGFFVTGTSTPVCEEDYTVEKGENFAFDDAVRNLEKFLAFQIKQDNFEVKQFEK